MKISFRKTLKRALKISRIIFLVFAFFCLFLFIFSFTSGPFWIYYWLGTKNCNSIQQPKAIVLLSGGGMPSEDGLFRTYYAARAGREFPNIPIIISMPGDTSDMGSSITLTYQELILRDIDSTRVLFEPLGVNTREQALQLARAFPHLLADSILIVTSPVHMRRAILAFEKAGFPYVGSYSAFDRIIESNLSFEDRDLGGRNVVPGLGDNINLRYRFWGHLKLEIDMLREFIALGYYKLNGWI